MATLPPERSTSGAKRHSRVVSASRTPLARRSTKGPLDVEDSPASETLSSAPLQFAKVNVEATNTPVPSTPFSPDKPPVEKASVPPSPPPKDYSYLLRPDIYHPLSQLDLPPAFRTPHYQPHPSAPIPELLSNHNFRSAATAAALRLCTPPEPPTSELFSLFYIRLACLTFINHLTLAAEESKALQDINSPFYTDSAGKSVLPWELRVLAIRLQGIGYGDTKKAIGGYYDLAKEARAEIKESSNADEKQSWKDRLEELSYHVANTLVDTGNLSAAVRHLESLRCKNPTENTSLDIRLALLYISIGNIDKAREYSDSMPIQPLIHTASGDYSAAAAAYRGLPPPMDDISTQNLAVCLFYNGEIEEAMILLDGLVGKGRSFHALTFNLATMYELCSEKGRERKGELVGRVEKNVREGGGGERIGADFKL